MSIGGEKSSGGTQSTQESRDFGTEVWAAQRPYLRGLWSRGRENLGRSSLGTIQSAMYMDSAGSNARQAARSLNASNAALTNYLTPGIDPSVNAYAKNLGQQFREQFLPELQGQAALAGGLGGSRQQIGSALGAQRAMQTLGDFTAQTYSGQAERALAAAQSIGANAAGFQNNAQQQLMTADFARSMPWYNLAQYQGLLGSPTQLDKGGYSTGSSVGKQGSSGWNFGWS